ncbi:AAA family ATPase [Methanocella sp. MCL-LM]|uniref:AAA family ATPase n=1 Tax=Methanocella sp. MCL-LM TaxID=3412035 RepID=UPI003C781639
MYISRIRLTNWKNFLSVDVPLKQRLFIVGPNASGKSNLLDAFYFLHDIAKSGGGLDYAITKRGGIHKIRCLASRRNPIVEIEVELKEKESDETPEPDWVYTLGIGVQQSGTHQPCVKYEKVIKKGDQDPLINRPDNVDKGDEKLLLQTHLQQISANVKFRVIAEFFAEIRYFQIVPQLIKNPYAFSGENLPEDPYGRDFLDLLANVPEKTRTRRLKKIESLLKGPVPSLSKLEYKPDVRGRPHLEVKHTSWRKDAGKQSEKDLSDGTLRMIGLFWSLLEPRQAPLLLEEPELSLNNAVVQQLPELIYKIEKQKKVKGQVFISTHSYSLLTEYSIGSDEVVILTPEKEATKVEIASDKDEVKQLLDSGFNVAEAVYPVINEPITQKNLGDFLDD